MERNDVSCKRRRPQLRWMDTKDMCRVTFDLTVPTGIFFCDNLAKNDRTSKCICSRRSSLLSSLPFYPLQETITSKLLRDLDAHDFFPSRVELTILTTTL